MRVYLMLTQLKEKKKKIERISIREPLETYLILKKDYLCPLVRI